MSSRRQWGTRAPFPPDWQQRRLTVFARDNWTCIDCGWHDATGRTLECDHLGDTTDNRIHMLATRCGVHSPRNCHGTKTGRAGAAARQRQHRPTEPHPGLR